MITPINLVHTQHHTYLLQDHWLYCLYCSLHPSDYSVTAIFTVARWEGVWGNGWKGKDFLFTYLFIFKNFILFLERGEWREKGRERNINVWLPLMCPLLGTWPATQAHALTGNQTGDPLVHRLVLNPLSHTSQGGKDFKTNFSSFHFPFLPTSLPPLYLDLSISWYLSFFISFLFLPSS